MNDQNRMPEPAPAEDIYAREEQCQKAIRTVRKAILMRFVVAVLMVWVVCSNPSQIWAWGIMAFVLLTDVIGAIPLVNELKRQKRLLAELIAQEEE